jgi:hypothetical protein
MKRCGFLALLVALAAASTPALATRQFSVTQTAPAPAPPSEMDMSSSQTLTFTVANTSTGTNATERIYRLRIRLNGTCTGTGCVATLFTSGSAAPLNWTRTAFSTTSITYQASTWNDAILVGTPLSVSVVVTAGKSTQDRTETLRDVRAYFTTDTNFANGISQTGTVTLNTPGSWILQSLQITGFQTTDTSGNPVSAIAAGTTFRAVITVKNISSATLSGIVANPSPPTAATSGGFGTSPSCSLTSTSPSPLNLTTGSSGTMTYTCTTIASNSGTVTYSVTDVRISGGAATSRSGTSNSLSVSPLSVSIAVTGPYSGPPTNDPTCHFSGDTATFVMTVKNNTAANITSITPSSLTFAGTSTTAGAFAGPTAACTFPLAVGNSCTYTWTAPVSIVGSYPASGAKPVFQVTGSATANPGSLTSPVVTSNSQDVDGFVISVSPTGTNANSTSQQLTFTVINRACDNLNQVAIAAPGGFTYSGDGYSLVNDNSGTGVPNESWGQSATTFTAPLNNAPAVDAGRMPNNGSSGDFSLVFTPTPSAAGTYTFNLNLIDENGVARPRTVDVPVSAFGTGTLNSSTPATWHEVFQ